MMDLTQWFTDSEIVEIEAKLKECPYPELITTRSDVVAYCFEGCYYDEVKAVRFEQFCERFITQVAGRFKQLPLKLFPWQKAIFRKLFGWLRPDGTRRFRYLYFSVSKKNGKSAICSALALYMLMADGESNAQIYCCAQDRTQAGIVFNTAANYVKASKNLSKYLKVIPSTKRITYERQYSFLRAISKDTSVADGIDAHMICFDEFHLSQNTSMYETLRYSGAARSQPLFVIITTAGDSLDTPCGKEYQYCKKVVSGEVVDTQCLSAIYEADLDDDPSDPDVWRKANPSLDLIIDEKDLSDAYNAAIETGQLSNFKRRRMNVWCKDSSFWISRDLWDKCRLKPFPSLEDLANYSCFFGLDIADTSDITALMMIWKSENGLLYVKPWFHVPEDTVHKRSIESNIPYTQWVDEGWLHTTEGAVTDFEMLEERIHDLSLQVNFSGLYYDPWSALALVNKLDAFGIECIKVPQTIGSLSEPMKFLERSIKNNSIVHDGNPVMTWMMSNVIVKHDYNRNCRPDRKASKDKIDGPAALITGLVGVLHGVEEDFEPYNGCGIAVL